MMVSSVRGDTPSAISTNTSSGTKRVSPGDGMLTLRPPREGVALRDGGSRGGVLAATGMSGNNEGPIIQPTGPRKQLSVERPTSAAVISRPSTAVPIIGDTAAQTRPPAAYQPSGVKARVVIGSPRDPAPGGPPGGGGST